MGHIRKNAGITLIALIITVIILLILAGIGLNTINRERGIIDNAEYSVSESQKASDMEKLRTYEISYFMEKHQKATLEKFIDYLDEKEAIDKDTVEYTDSPSAIITLEDGYLYEIKEKENKELEITFEGTAGEIAPVIEISITGKSTSEATAVLTIKRNTNVNIKYYIKEENESEYTLKEETKNSTYTFTGLIQNKKYNIKVVATASNGKTAEATKDVSTTGIVQPEVTFAYEPGDWTNGSVKVTATATAVEGMTLYIGEDATNCTTPASTGITVASNKQVYAVFKDSTGQYGGAATGNVDKIDKTKPVVGTVEVTTNQVTVTATDTVGEGEINASGVVKYALTTTNSEPAASSFQESGIFTGKSQGTPYYAWAMDKAGNISNGKATQTSSVTKPEVTFAYEPGDWTNGSVKVTATATEVEGMTLYIGEDATNCTTLASTGITVASNKQVYAVFKDNTGQYGGAATGNVDKIDKTKPVVGTVEVTTNQVTVTATDTVGEGEINASGVVKYALTTTNSEPAASSFQESGIFTGKSQGTPYYAWAMDKAGNISNGKATQTSSVTKPEVTFAYEPGDWTNGSVKVTATATAVEGMTLYIGEDATNCTTPASTGITVASNKQVYAVFKDSTGQYGGAATGNVDKIDKTNPNAPTLTPSGTKSGNDYTSDITVAITDNGDTFGEIDYIEYSVSGAQTVATTRGTSVTINTEGISTITAYVYDKAGNKSSAGELTVTKAYTISYTLNGGTLATANPTNYTAASNSITLNNPTRNGYTFKGWSGTGLTGDTNTNVTIPAGSTGNRAYTANWIGVDYTIGYTLNGGTVATANPTTYTVTTNSITLNNPTRTGYTFKGWSGTGLTGDTNKTVTIAKGSTGNRTYTANWTGNSYTVAFDANGGSGTMSNQTGFVYGTNKALNQNTFKRTGYAFAGWKLNNTGNVIADKANVSTLVTSGTATLYAQWEANALTFNNQTITKDYSTVAQTANVTLATNGTGTYTYTEVSEKSGSTNTSYISISGTTINIAASTPANTYTYVIRAKDSNSGKTKDATYTIKVNKANPTVTLSATSGTVNVGSEATFTAKPSVAGKWNVTTGDARYVTISSPAANAAATANTATTIKYKGVAATTTAVTITVKFTPTDTTNYNEVSKTFSVTKVNATVSVTTLKEGDWVKYNTGVSGVGTISCRVLYNDSTHGLQIISADIVGSGISMEGKEDYNDAISILNTEAAKYKNSTYAYDARCVGSYPNVSSSGTFSNKNKEVAGPITLQFTYNGSTSLNVKNTDTNYTTDWNKMGSLGESAINIRPASDGYWLASRYVDSQTYEVNLCVRYAKWSGELSWENIYSCASYSGAVNVNTYKYIRPCFSLKTSLNLTGGDGTTEAKAYTLGT